MEPPVMHKNYMNESHSTWKYTTDSVRIEHRKLPWATQHNYQQKLIYQLGSLPTSNPKAFWKILEILQEFNKIKKIKNENNHFKQLRAGAKEQEINPHLISSGWLSI